MNIIEVYEAGSSLVLSSGITGVVETAIIGANGAVRYQLIVSVPERHTIVCNDFEVTPVEGRVIKQQIGFTTTYDVEEISVPNE